ncbi:MAG: hypothetical protein KTR24_09565 [Saprospiraceae bacterium]|nr:hypothetical protein [Saprospiraceae bacterium]
MKIRITFSLMLLGGLCLCLTSPLSGQRCNNVLANAEASRGMSDWTTNNPSKRTANWVVNGAFAPAAPYAEMWQEVEVPERARRAILTGWARNSPKAAKDGKPVALLQAWDSRGTKLDHGSTGNITGHTHWQDFDLVLQIPRGAARIRVVLTNGYHRTSKHMGTAAQFDNLALAFDCTKKTTKP